MVQAVLPVYDRFEVSFERGEGAYLFDTDGRRWLDFGAGVAVSVLGHVHPHLVAALTAQAQKVWHVSNLYHIPAQERLAARLSELTFADVVFFVNSGAEAWETAVKILRKHFSAAGQPEKNRIITVEGAFHGRTLAAISATKQARMADGFGPLMDGFDQVKPGDIAALRAAITPQTAGISLETVMGEGGMQPISLEYLRDVRKLADEFGLLLLLDEIQCGMGRTGKLFAYEWAGITPDIMCIAKAIGGGFPLGACLATSEAAKGMTAGTHGSTFGGNPLGMEVGNAVLDIVAKPDFLKKVAQKAQILQEKLNTLVEQYPHVLLEVRGSGLMLGLKCAPSVNNRDFVIALMKQHMLAVPAADNVVRLLPPLIIEQAEIDLALKALTEVCKNYD